MKTSEDTKLSERVGHLLGQDWPLYALLAVVTVLTAAVYHQLPAEVPIHWNWRGEVDNMATRLVAVLLLPATAVGIHLLSVVTLAIDPKLGRGGQSETTLRLFRLAGPVFSLGLHVVLLAIWLGHDVQITDVVYAATGVLFAVLGNVMGRLPPNYVVGIRLPWTLEDPMVWKRTHRFAGRLWFMGGCALLFSPLLVASLQFVYFMAITALLVIAPGVFAYREYQQIA